MNVLIGDEAKDFLGNEFLTWLWHEAAVNEGVIDLENQGHATVFFDRSLDLDCSYGMTGRDALRGDGVTRMPEALDGLRSGKVPRKAGLTVEFTGDQFSFSINGESFAITALKLPEVEEADTPRVLFEERIAMLRMFSILIDSLFRDFLKTRFSSTWPGRTKDISKWISKQVTKPTRALVEVN